MEPTQADMSIFFLAVWNGKTEEVRETLAKWPSLANMASTIRGGQHPVLCRAAHEGHLEIVKMLVAAGADINAVDGDGYSVVWNAILGDRDGVIAYLRSLATPIVDPRLNQYLGMKAYEQEKQTREAAQAPDPKHLRRKVGCFTISVGLLGVTVTAIAVVSYIGFIAPA